MSIDDEWDETGELSGDLSLAYGDGHWVAGGAGCYVSPYPEGPWAKADDNATASIYAVRYANGRWVAVGGVIRTTTDALGTWSAPTTGVENAMFDVAYGDGIWVTAGATNRIYTATNPAGTWTLRTTANAGAFFYGVAYGGGNWVAVGDSGRIRYATDPTGTWSTPSSGSGNPSGKSRTFHAVAYGDGHWLAVGVDFTGATPTRIALTATDPSGTWSVVDLGGNYTSYGFGGVAYMDGVWIVRGGSSAVLEEEIRYATSIGGTWTSVPTKFNVSAYTHFDFDGDIFAGLGGEGVIYQQGEGAGWGLKL